MVACPPGQQEAPATRTKTEPFRLGFTKSNELFVGRMAMLGFASSLIGGERRSVHAVGTWRMEEALRTGW